MRRILETLGLVVSALFAGLVIVLSIVGWEDRAARAARLVRVDAQVVENSYREWREGKSLRCENVFRFQYVVDGTTYTSTRLRLDGSTPCANAERLQARVPVGAGFTAYHDPLDPSLSFAFATSALMVYLAVPISGVVIVALAWLWFVLRDRRPRSSSLNRSGEWFALPPVTGAHTRFILATAAALWWSITLPYAYAQWKLSSLGYVLTWTDGLGPILGTVAILGFTFVLWRRQLTFADPKVALSAYPLVPGEPVTVRVVQHIKRPVRIHDARVRLEARSPSTRRDRLEAFELAVKQLGLDGRQGMELVEEFTLTVPYIESYNSARKDAYRWYLIFTMDGPGLVDQRAVFPIAVVGKANPIYDAH